MAQIISSIFTESPPEIDGRVYIRELHTANDGQTFIFEYLADLTTIDPNIVLSLRAQQLNTQLSIIANSQQIIGTIDIPWTKSEFINKFTTAEWTAYLNFVNTYQTMLIDQSIKDTIKVGLFKFDHADSISKNNPDVINILGLMEQFGIIASGRAQQVLNG